MKRREFVEKSLCAAVSSAAFTSLATKMSLAHAATPQRLLAGEDYRALVCVYLYGGNDSYNMVVPVDASHHAIYAATRGALALPRTGSAGTTLLPLTSAVAANDGASYGLHPAMTELAGLFNRTTGGAIAGASPVAIVANAGPLLYPITQAQFLDESVPTPPQLFSHSDQTVFWQTPSSNATSRLGWGGRLADLTTAVGQNPTLSMNVSLDGENVFEAGENVVPYFINPYGVEDVQMDSTDTWPPGQQARRAVFNTLLNANLPHPLERAYAAQMKRTLTSFGQFNTALELPLNTTVESRFNYALNGNGDIDDWLGGQLRMVARLINRRASLGMVRQIFFVGIGGFDTHTNQLADHVGIMRSVSRGLAAFYQATVDMGLADKITTFTASEFGRTLTPNANGTDHGWGGHQIVVGGAVTGRRYYGNFPSLLATNNPNSTGWGSQIIPTTSVDQYAWTLARWYGLQNGDRDLIFPNVTRFGGVNHYHLDFLGT
jgi:uncharacterized protein (DUF1501 family)